MREAPEPSGGAGASDEERAAPAFAGAARGWSRDALSQQCDDIAKPRSKSTSGAR